MNELQLRQMGQSEQGSVSGSGIKVAFLSRWKFNPYQKLLTDNLKELGVQIEEGDCNTYFLPGLLKNGKPDIVHLQQIHPFFLRGRNKLVCVINLIAFLSELLILKLMGVKLIWTTHDLKNHGNRMLKIDRFGTTVAAKMIHAIVVHCHAAKDEIVKAYNLKDKDKIHVVPHGHYIDFYENKIDRTTARQQLNIPESSLVFLFLGWIRGYKGVLELIQTFKQLSYSNTHLVVAGKPWTEELDEVLKQETAEHDNITFVSGFVPDEEIQVYMNAADVAVFPYRDILTSGAVLLAMSFNKACIAARKCCIGEVLDDSGAFLYDPDDAEGLSQSIGDAVQRRTDLAQMGEYNYEVVQQWSWNRVAELTIKLYRHCLNDSKPA